MDVNMLFSIVNMKLRDEFESLEELCRYYDIEQVEIEKKLEEGGYSYSKENNKFRPELSI
jgi:hypothetical protein